MNKCPITYQPSGSELYSKSGLAKLSPRLHQLKKLPFSAQEQRIEATSRAVKMSIQGVQAKLSARLSVKDEEFKIVDQGGTFIIKPQSDRFQQVPENEDLTMKMAAVFGIEVPLTGLVYSKDDSFSYFIKRFDRYAQNKKYHIEDFAQLTGNTRDTKYRWSMEKLLPIIDQFCTFPMLEKHKLFRRTLFCFITGNEDMHLKNFSLISRENKIEFSPAYDLLNSSIAMGSVVEELALPLSGKKNKIKGDHLFDYFAAEKMQLSVKVIQLEIDNLKTKKLKMKSMINNSFLNSKMKTNYLDLLNDRYERLNLR